MVLGGILLSSWHIPFSRYLYMHAIVLDVSVLVAGQVELLFRREDHMTKLASFFLTRAWPQAKAGWMNPGVCHRTARLCPREGMSQLHVPYGLEGGISMMMLSYALDKGIALLAASAAKGACSVKPCRSRRLLRLIPKLRNTSSPHPIVHVAVLPDRRHNRDQAAMLACTFHLPVPPVQRPQIKMPACRADCVHVAEGRPCA